MTEKTKTQYEYHRDEDEFSDKPIEFSKSRAVGSSSENLGLGFRKVGQGPPPAQAPSIIISLCVFMIYFLILREESDIDDMINSNPKSLYEQMPGLEKIHVETAIKNYKLEGRNTDDLEKRLAEIVAAEKA